VQGRYTLDVVRCGLTDTPGHVSVEPRRVTKKQLPELGGPPQRSLDDLAICAHNRYSLERGKGFTRVCFRWLKAVMTASIVTMGTV
jgi:hypothetical protein